MVDSCCSPLGPGGSGKDKLKQLALICMGTWEPSQLFHSPLPVLGTLLQATHRCGEEPDPGL
jgi:hypothetical protein